MSLGHMWSGLGLESDLKLVPVTAWKSELRLRLDCIAVQEGGSKGAREE